VEGATSKLLPDSAFTGHYEEDEFALAFARIEVHYFFNKGFSKPRSVAARRSAHPPHPGAIVQGRYDVVCPMESAWALYRAWPEADLIVTPDSGHSAFDPPNSRALVAATTDSPDPRLSARHATTVPIAPLDAVKESSYAGGTGCATTTSPHFQRWGRRCRLPSVVPLRSDGVPCALAARLWVGPQLLAGGENTRRGVPPKIL